MAEIGLKLFSKSTVGVAVSDAKFTCNPTIDLLATVGDENNLYIWRANDQLVAKHTERGQKVGAIRWKEDGQFLAAGWGDGVVRLVGLENSKAVHQIRVTDDSSVAIQFIAWSRNHTGRREGRKLSAKPDAWQQLLGGRELDDKKEVLDLPLELTFLEVDTALPKLSPLPVSGGSGDDMFVFSTRASLEFVFRPFDPDDADKVDVMIVGTSDGGIHLSIYDSFVIGAFKDFVRVLTRAPGTLQLCGHGSNPDVSTHFLLLRPEEERDRKTLYLVPMDLTFVHSSPINLSLLASKTTTLQNLLRYVKQTQSHIVSEWKSTRELPNRFLNSVQEDLKETYRGPMTIVQALFHTVVTGHVFPQVKEWLGQSVAERGHKRWDKAVVTGLENLRGLVHENLMPGLERCAIILSRLLGLARFHASQESIGFTVTQIENLIDIVSCLTLVAHKILIAVMDELDHFKAFSTWLRFEIVRVTSPSMSDELTEMEATMDHETVLTYIRNYLMESPMAIHLEEVAREDYTKDWDHVEDGVSRLEMLDKQLKKQEQGKPYMKALPNLGFLVTYLTAKSNAVFTDIAKSEKRGVRFGRPAELSIGKNIGRFDVHVCAKHGNDGIDVTTFTAVIPDDRDSTVHVFRSETHIVNGISGNTTTSVCTAQLLTKVVDLKFLDDKALLVLCHGKDSRPLLVRIPYQSPLVMYFDFKPSHLPKPLVLQGEEYAHFFTPMEFACKAKSLPSHMEVRKANKARGEIPARVCLMGPDDVSFEVYAIPRDWEKTWNETKVGLAKEDVDMG